MDTNDARPRYFRKPLILNFEQALTAVNYNKEVHNKLVYPKNNITKYNASKCY